MSRIRIVSYKGKTTLRREFLDENGDLVNLSLDSVELTSKDPKEFMLLLDAIAEARKLPIICVNAANKHIYFNLNAE